MKKLSQFIYLILLLFSSCDKRLPIEEESEEAALYKMVVQTRAVGTISYPIQVFAFDAGGKCAGSQTIQSASEKLSLNLSSGSFRIVAIAGASASDYDIPSNPTENSFIRMKNGNASATPLMMGSAEVNMSKSTTINIQLSYAVASIDVQVTDVPADVSGVSIRFTAFASQLSFSGELSGSSSVERVCTRQSDGHWTLPTFYTFRGVGSQTVLTIDLTTSADSHSYGYTYQGLLEPGVPYNLKGSYQKGFQLGGVIGSNGWGDAQDIRFDFGAASGGGQPTEPTDPVNPSGELPSLGTLWQGCLVALVSNATATEEDVLLLSPRDWAEVYATKGTDVVTSYQLNNWTDWRLPTGQEARALMNQYDSAESVEALNSTLSTAGADALCYGGTYRYLCDEGSKTFVLAGSGTVSSAGAKRTYNVRAVRSVHFTK